MMKYRYCLTVLLLLALLSACPPRIYPGRVFNYSDQPVTVVIADQKDFHFSVEVPAHDGVRASLPWGEYDITYRNSDGLTLAVRQLKFDALMAGRALQPGPDCPGIKKEEFDFWVISYRNPD